MPSIYDDSGGDTPLRNSTNNSGGDGGGGGGLNDDDENAGDINSKVCGICDTGPHNPGLCFDPITPFCQATLSSVDQITCGGVQSMTAGGLPSPHGHTDGPLEKLFKFRPSSYVVMSDYFTRGGSGGSDMQQQQHKDEREREDNGRHPRSMRINERGGKAAALLKRTYPLSYNGEAPIGPTKCEYCAAESTLECTSNLPEEYNALFMGTATATAICKNITPATTTTSSSSTPRPAMTVCHRPKLFFLKKRPPFATMDGWNPVTEYRINLFEPPTTMEGMDRGWGEVRGHLGDKTSSNSNNNTSTTSAGGGDFGYGSYGNNNNNNNNMNATIDKEGGRGGESKSTIETASTVRAGNRISVVTNSTNNIHDDNSEGKGGGNGDNGRTMSSSPVQWAWSGLMGILTPKSSKENIIK